jgi:hypothetical protein
MTSRPHLVHPPRLAVWLISLFALAHEAESILGDLLEEFALIVSKSGVTAARHWYWRQTIRTLPRLAGFSFRTAPWLTLTAVAGGFLLRKLIGPLIGSATFAVIQKYQTFFENHFSAYLFFTSTGLDIEHLITFLLIGFIVAYVAREREILATGMLAFIFGSLAIAGSAYMAIMGNDVLQWRLMWYFADSIVIVIAGAIVRTHRLAVKARPSSA